MINYIHNLKLKTKIFISCVIIVVLAILTFSRLLYTYVSHQNTEVFYENSKDMLVQASRYLDEKLKAISGRVYAMRVNPNFDKTIKEYIFNEQTYTEALVMSRLAEAFSEIRTSDDFISSIYLYTPKGSFSELSRTIDYNYDFTRSELYHRIGSSPKATLYWGKAKTDDIYLSHKQVVPLVFRFNIDGYANDIYMIINLDEQAIINYLEDLRHSEGYWYSIIDNKGEAVLAGDSDPIKALLQDQESVDEILENDGGVMKRGYHSQGYIVTYQKTMVAPWKIVSVKSEKTLMERSERFKFYVLVLSLAGIAFCFILALLVASSITRPLTHLQKTIREVTNRKFDIEFEYYYENELGDLGRSFNFMVKEIRDLIAKLDTTIIELSEEKERVRIEQLLKRRAELKALQAQINPHFLYNTLDSINWIAKSIDSQEICKMTTALATLFRTGLSRGQEVISLKEEISHVSSYLVIQKIRYGDKFDYEINMEEELFELYTVKLLLQPLVENAIYHGIKDKDGSGWIKISGAIRGDGLELVVEDNGLGINKLNLMLINKRLSEGITVDKQGYGIYNVNERIKLYFGERYGLSFTSEPGCGTKARLLIPHIKSEDVDQYVQIISR